MNITAVETLRTAGLIGVNWVQVQADAAGISLGEAVHGADAVESLIHDRPMPEGVRAFHTGRHEDLLTVRPTVEDGLVLPTEGPDSGTNPLPAALERPDPTPRRSEK